MERLLGEAFSQLGKLDRDNIGPVWTINGVKIRPQFKVPSYVIDFAVFTPRGVRAAVEVDGYEFHNTRDRFRHDRERMRNLEVAGWRNLHFAGSEVHENARLCADKIIQNARELDAAYSLFGATVTDSQLCVDVGLEALQPRGLDNHRPKLRTIDGKICYWKREPKLIDLVLWQTNSITINVDIAKTCDFVCVEHKGTILAALMDDIRANPPTDKWNNEWKYHHRVDKWQVVEGDTQWYSRSIYS